ncbi:MAG: hypothetical protein WBB98_03960 [Xanthobacteraceae bacterium]
MNHNDDLLTEVKAATADYRTARQNLDYHRGLARHGMSNNLAFAVTAEHSAFHRMQRASAAFEAAQSPPSPKPTATVAPKPATAPVTPKTVAQPQASSAFLDYLIDQCGGQLSPLDPRFRRGR